MSPYAFDDINFPWYFWLTAVVLLGLIVEACRQIRTAWAIPALILYGTIGAWYLGDMIQTGAGNFLTGFGEDLTRMAMGQVILFLVSYRLFVYWLLPRRNDPRALTSVADKIQAPELQKFFYLVFILWMVLFCIGLTLAKGDLLGIIWPPSTAGAKVGMFVRDGIGSGADFLVSTGAYIYTLVCAIFGILFILGRGPIRWMAFAMIPITWPYFLFDRARSGMLALMLPAIFCYLIATWGHWVKKALVCVVAFVLIYLWFGQVMHYRDTDTGGNYNVTSLLDFSHERTEQQGLDMLKELCYIDHYISTGEYAPNWGGRYFAEAVGFVPRTIWANKPLIGYDYAYVRGYRNDEMNSDAVYATISTGMVGQGVTNFGRFFGVVAAAFLMSLWTLILSKLWRRRFELPRFLLFLVGGGLTFNLGRDITLLVIWPFVFGFGLVLWYEWMEKRAPLARRTRRLVGSAPRPVLTPRPVIARGQP